MKTAHAASHTCHRAVTRGDTSRPAARQTAVSDWCDRAEFWAHVPSLSQTHRSRSTQTREPLILSGHGIGLRINHGALEVRNGFTHYPQVREEFRFFPGDWRQPSRIIVIDGDGGLTFDVLAWLAEQRIPLVQLDWRGNARIVAGAGYAADPGLVTAQRRLQADPKRRMQANCWLIHEKLTRSVQTLHVCVPDDDPKTAALAELDRSMRELKAHPPTTVNDLRGIEGRAALAYFRAWRAIPLRWQGTGRRPIPNEWHHCGARVRPQRTINRGATHPLNAILNYAYAVLESQVRMGIVAAGLDPAIGLMHTERKSRPAFVLDLMEPLRPVIDAAVLRLVQANTFAPQDFTLATDGTCRLHPALARSVVSAIGTMDANRRATAGLLRSLPFHG